MWFITLLLMLFLTENGCFGCSCAPKGPLQVAFCRSSFVIKGKAVKEELNPPIDEGDLYSSDFRYWDVKRIYDVNVIEVFKAPENVPVKPGDVIQAVTRASGSLCGGSLELDTEQLIIGGVNGDGQLAFGLCSHKERNGLTPLQLEGLRGEYSC
ncbi:metalloproteinase inhibitor 3-like [Mytilus edulis]|uniref:metalloproteinase inhibitor 3-like n=1 Tax=Mytilus edulis TaxID=6550 RepID=UPI0039EFE053